MKIRLGFVSNSSSASYYVTLRDSWDRVSLAIKENCHWPYFEENDIMLKINDATKIIQERLSYLSNHTDSWLCGSKEQLELRIKKLEDTKSRIIDITNTTEKALSLQKELVEIILKLNNIELSEVHSDYVVLFSDTVMHNSYEQGMPELLKEIVLFYSFENPGLIRLKVEHHNM